MIRQYTQTFVKAAGVFTGAVPTPGVPPVTDPASGTPDALSLTALDGWHTEIVLGQAATFLGDALGAFDVWLWTGTTWMKNPSLEQGNDAGNGDTAQALPDVPITSGHTGQAVRVLPRAVTTSGADGSTMTITVRGRQNAKVR